MRRFDTIPIEQKFGYAANVEKQTIRKRLLEAGHADDMTLLFDVEKEYMAAHANDPSYKETSTAWFEKHKAVSKSFSREELERLVEHFENANDPVLISIREKAIVLLSK